MLAKNSFDDLNCKYNSSKYHTGKKCCEEGCDKLAGTAWSPYWCVEHNIIRIKRINEQLEGLTNGGGG